MKPVDHDEYADPCRCSECVAERITIAQRPATCTFDNTDNDND